MTRWLPTDVMGPVQPDPRQLVPEDIAAACPDLPRVPSRNVSSVGAYARCYCPGSTFEAIAASWLRHNSRP